jgi:acetyltransferase-like isoleucine patch superfamily enzyme
MKQLASYLCRLAVWPLAFLSNIGSSETLFATFSQYLALVPGVTGSYLRVAYHSMTLDACPLEGRIAFGTFFSHKKVELGEGFYIGSYCIIGMAKIGANATIGSNVHLLSGRNQHNYSEVDIPIQKQGGSYRQLNIGENCWIGNGSIVMADLGKQNVVAAGSVVVEAVDDYKVIAGNPARILREITNIES